jgi:hypothetical protein
MTLSKSVLLVPDEEDLIFHGRGVWLVIEEHVAPSAISRQLRATASRVSNEQGLSPDEIKTGIRCTGWSISFESPESVKNVAILLNLAAERLDTAGSQLETILIGSEPTNA